MHAIMESLHQYAAKPEKHYYLEGARDSVKEFLKCRTIGACIVVSRLLGFHVVRSTRPCTFVSPQFVLAREFCCPRDDAHIAKHPDYPHPSISAA